MVAISKSSRRRAVWSPRVYGSLVVGVIIVVTVWNLSQDYDTTYNSSLLLMNAADGEVGGLAPGSPATGACKIVTATPPSKREPKPIECSGNGQTLFDECLCDVGWQGSDCSTAWKSRIPTCGPYNDRCFFHSDYGVAKVNKARWQGAQKYENDTWAEQRTSDRNDEHANNFVQYASLVAQSTQNKTILGDMIEFGSGPFTQSLTIFETTHLEPQNIVLLEPLSDTYRKTVHACRYKDGSLGMIPKERVQILPIPAEQLDTQAKQYDTILLLNFVEHVMDAFHNYKTAFDALREGGLVIFHERYWPGYNGKESKNLREFDLHPIRLSGRFAHWLATEFDLLYEKEQDERWGNLGYYWIGRKRSVSMRTYLGPFEGKLGMPCPDLGQQGLERKQG